MSEKETNEYGGLLKKNPKLGVLVLVLTGLAILWYAFKTYNDLTQWEQEGGTRPMNRLFAVVYDIAGVWGVSSLMAAGGFFFLYQAYVAYNKLIKK
ncbi:hypothetical protein [Capnocytophaga sp.]|uniref:hypothetical protein n=1 Tax=Capnocytophaga sp. TaxID=44737 RepID=UPI0026DC6691|nr:hypothetical protein [Capnocytophaga sp.]MDO5105217.1 hypothetical protein [Capnocytophaga sp.]